MSVAYVDTSCLVAIAFGEPGAETVAERLERYDHRVSSNLLEAELRSALAREEVDESPDPLLASLGWLLPDRPLGPEYATALAAGYLRGADLRHVACALYLRSFVPGLAFVTLDGRQQSIADTLGFPG